MHSFSHIGILVKNLEVMKDFYIKFFKMKVLWYLENEKCYLTTGNNDILGLQVGKGDFVKNSMTLSDIETSSNTPNFFHFGTVTNSITSFQNLKNELINNNISITKVKKSRDQTESFYFLDPEHNFIQICFTPIGYFENI